MSLFKNWATLKRKLGPLETDELDPIQPHLGRLIKKTPVTEYPIVRALLWTTMNCEEFYYQNTSLLVINHLDDLDTMCTLLNDHRNVVKWKDRLYKFSKLGEGSYGIVYSAKDRKTKKYIAVKEIKPPKTDNLLTLNLYLMDVLMERNTLSELNKCSFFIKLISAFHSETDNSYKILTELCVADLSDIFTLCNKNNEMASEIRNSFISDRRMKEIDKLMSKRLHYKYHKLIFIYFFEMLCALHYLATKHVLHADIKLQNILISQMGHIKFADFGMALRNQWYEKPFLLNLESDSDLLAYKAKKFNDRGLCGTPGYFDPEMVIYEILKNEDLKKKLMDEMKGNVQFDKVNSYKQNFMSDLYAVGLSAFALIFGFLIQLKKYSILKTSFWQIQLAFSEFSQKKILKNHLIAMAENNEAILSIMNLLLSILRPREIRSQDYISTLNMLKDGKLISEKYIDIDKIENIQYYKSLEITRESVINISLKKVATTINRKITKSKKSINDKVKMLNIKETPCDKLNFFKIHPLDYVAEKSK